MDRPGVPPQGCMGYQLTVSSGEHFRIFSLNKMVVLGLTGLYFVQIKRKIGRDALRRLLGQADMHPFRSLLVSA